MNLNRRQRMWLYRNRKMILLVYLFVLLTVGTVLQILQSAGVWP